jgi:hypothetical protein
MGILYEVFLYLRQRKDASLFVTKMIERRKYHESDLFKLWTFGTGNSVGGFALSRKGLASLPRLFAHTHPSAAKASGQTA